MPLAPVTERNTRADITVSLLNCIADGAVKAMALFIQAPGSFRYVEGSNVRPPEGLTVPEDTDLEMWMRDHLEMSPDEVDISISPLEHYAHREGSLCLALKKNDSFRNTDAFRLFREHETEVAAIFRHNLDLEAETDRIRELFRAALFASPHAIAIFRKDDGVVLHANSAFEEFLGLSGQEAVGKRLWDVDPFRERGRLRDAFHESTQTHRPVTAKLTRNGNEAATKTNATFVNFDSACIVITDITDSYKLRSNLINSEKRWAIHRMLSKLVHDITNSITGISGYTQMLAYARDEENLEETVQKVQQEARRCKSLIQQLREAASPQPKPFGRVDVRKLVFSCIDFAQINAQWNGITLNAEFHGETPRIRGDYYSLQCALDEAIANSLECYRESGGAGSIDLIVHKKNKGVVIEVHDQAGGAPQPNRVLEPFYTTHGYSGHTGMGMPTIKAIVEDHQGSVEFESEEKHSVLRISLPA